MSDQALVDELRSALNREIGALRDEQKSTAHVVNEIKTSIALLGERIGDLVEIKARVRALELSQARMFGAAAVLGALSGGAMSGLARVLGG